jgi:hypothetical protein
MHLAFGYFEKNARGWVCSFSNNKSQLLLQATNRLGTYYGIIRLVYQ